MLKCNEEMKPIAELCQPWLVAETLRLARQDNWKTGDLRAAATIARQRLLQLVDCSVITIERLAREAESSGRG